MVLPAPRVGRGRTTGAEAKRPDRDRTPDPQPAPERRTADPKTHTLRELAARAQQRASIIAKADASRVAIPPDAVPLAPDPEPQTLPAKKARVARRAALVQNARDRAANMPPGYERTQLLARAGRFEDDSRAVDRMRLAKHVYDYYDDKNTPPPLGFEQITDPDELKKYGVSLRELEPRGTGFRATLYRSQLDPSGVPIIAFRGTTSGENGREDWMNNGTQALAGDAQYYDRALRIGAKLAERTAGSGGFQTVGHSLGGGLASAVSAANHMPGDTFNAAGVTNTTLGRVGKSRANGADVIRTYRVEHEILSIAQNRSVQRGLISGAAGVTQVGGALGGPVGGAIGSSVSNAIPGFGMWREKQGDRVGPPALGQLRTIPAVDAEKFSGPISRFDARKYVDRHLAPATIASFEAEKASDSRYLRTRHV